MSKILVIEDEPALARAIARGLEEELYLVDVEHEGRTGLWAARTGGYDLVILDLMLPGLAGMEICRRLRAGGSSVPILILTARDSTEDIVTGLDEGASDYMTKPFAFEELLARVRAQLRLNTPARSARLQAADLALDTAAQRVWRADVEIELTAKEYQLLEYLMRHKGRTLSRGRLTEALWQGDLDPDSNALEVHMSALRRKIDRGRAVQLLHTKRGAGYSLREPER